MRKITASVVMYGGADEVHKSLESIAENTQVPGFRLYLVDNASPDGALQTIEKMGLPAAVQTVPLAQNKGFGTGHNAVLPLLDSEYHAVINPDIFLFDDALAQIVAWMEEHPDVAMAAPRLVFPDGREQNLAKRRPGLLPLVARQLPLPFLKGFERRYLMLDEDLSGPTDVEFCSGSFFVMRTEVFRKIGGFDEGYFMYVEDADITQKALQCGRAVFLPDITVAHAWHREAHGNLKKFFWQLRSLFRYFGKWGFKLT